MLDILWNTASFIVTLGILVTFHELGHFWVARKLGVKVLTFSVGFGKALWRRKGKDGTEYVLAAIPLGGYVKMLDEREGEVADADKHLAFNTQPVIARIAIVAAGPLANFLLAIVVYWAMFVIGIPALKPFLGDIPAQSIAAEAGLENGGEIIAVDGKPVENREDVNLAVVVRMGHTSEIVLSVRHPQETIVRQYHLNLKNWSVDPKFPDPLGSLGIVFWSPQFPPVLGEIVADNPAERAGLKAGDIIDSIGQKTMKSWSDIVTTIVKHPNEKLSFVIHRGTEIITMEVLIGNREATTGGGGNQGFLGVHRPELSSEQRQKIDAMRYQQQFGVIEAIGAAMDKTWKITVLTFRFIGKIFSGEVSPQNLSGPITIAQGAGAFASYGFVFFLSFLGMISVNLGIINLLPIPVLDGGHLMYYLVELIRGKPIPEPVQEMGYRIGMFLVLSLMVFSIVNDIGRL